MTGTSSGTGRIDALVNNAGRAMLGAREEGMIDEARTLFEVDDFGAMRIRAVLPAMRTARRGHVIHSASVVGRISARFMGARGASKHALQGYSTTQDNDVRGTVVRAGFMRTSIAAGALRVDTSLDAYATARGRIKAAFFARAVTRPCPGEEQHS